MRTRVRRRRRSWTAFAATATLLKRQKPIGRSASAWWPGGRRSARPLARPPVGHARARDRRGLRRRAARPVRNRGRCRCPGRAARSRASRSRRSRRRAPRVDPQELLAGRLAGRDGAAARRQPLRLEAAVDRRQAARMLRMLVGRAVEEEALVVDQAGTGRRRRPRRRHRRSRSLDSEAGSATGALHAKRSQT